MQIESIRHKALHRFAETGLPKGLPSGSAERLRNMLAYLVALDAEEELRVPPNFGAHRLKCPLLLRTEAELVKAKNIRDDFIRCIYQDGHD